ncbi:MAG: response regulator transcription factor [Actinomycetota bacterium]|nr:response regulator transcription factor [Actinomycetota bacterium]
MKKIRVFVADDHELVRYALRTLFENEDDMEVVGEGFDTQSALDGACEAKPDVLLLDLRMPGGGGAVVCRRVKEKCPEVEVLVLTSFDEDDEVFAVLDAGAGGYILKDTRPDKVVTAVRALADGQAVFDSSVATRVISGRSSVGPNSGDGEFGSLSDREVEVLRLMAKGFSNKEIGRALWIGETTVKTHVSHILRKLGQNDRTQAVLAAVQAGIVELPGRK